MKKQHIVISTLCVLMAGTTSYAAQSTIPDANQPLDQVAPYPLAKDGFKRHVIYLPQLPKEDDAKVELLIGKTVDVDCNRHMLAGDIETETLEGWGYTYIVVEKVQPLASTMMACADNQKHAEFIAMNGIELQRYNSKLPIVVYAPKDIEVKYRVWHASDEVISSVEK